MKAYLIISILFFLNTQLWANERISKYRSIGKSPRGQYIAIEEYGFEKETGVPYSKVIIKNTWKQKTLKTQSTLKGDDHNSKLSTIRQSNINSSQELFKKYNIKI